LAILFLLNFAGCAEKTSISVEEGKSYSSKSEVAEYLHKYGKLPVNYITKSEAAKAGWRSSEGNLWDVTEKGSIGGDVFGNREGLLPKADGRIYYECDINYQGGFRGAERIVYSNDGLIYYTSDHYETFEKLY
jgi:guanyl-specific ribonuclease Sa